MAWAQAFGTKETPGRVAVHEPIHPSVMPLHHPSFFQTGQGHLHNGKESTAMSAAFFSSQNIENLQQQIRKRVYDMSQGQYVVGRQSDQHIQFIMASYYHEYACNKPTGIKQQIKTLNDMVVDDAAKRVFGQVEQQKMYERDISRVPVPLEHGIFISTKGVDPKSLLIV